MTTYGKTSTVCGACGRVFDQQVLTSTNSFGPSDLDMRPAPMRRWTMGVWAVQCPGCGHCGSTVETFDEALRPVLEGAAYRALLADEQYPELARMFLCAAMLCQAAVERHAAAGNEAQAAEQKQAVAMHRHYAAWALDDAKRDDLARECRSRAADGFGELLAAGVKVLEDPGLTEALVVDLLRRAGRGPEALALARQTLGGLGEGVVREVLVFQTGLLERGDTGAYTVGDAVKKKD